MKKIVSPMVLIRSTAMSPNNSYKFGIDGLEQVFTEIDQLKEQLDKIKEELVSILEWKVKEADNDKERDKLRRMEK